LAHLYTAFVALALGTTFGLIQVYERAGAAQAPQWFDYYRMLTAHGVLLALVFTTFFISGISTYAVYQSTEPKAPSLTIGWVGWWVMLAGTILAAVQIILGNATVLYTFYAPMKASPWFYVGATILVVGTWIVLADFIVQARTWRKTHPGRLPLPAFMALATFSMWFIATLGVAVEMLFLIPWAFGWTKTIDVELTRIFFWYFGHPLVYFWIMGAYVIWYGIVPRLLNVPVFSDPLTRVAFVILIVLSVPVGIHHQFADPGIGAQWKLLHTFLTLLVVIPSLMTAFAMFASFEEHALAKGRKGFVGIVSSLPWKDPAFAGICLAMVLFIFGGFGGIVNASYSMNSLVHNTMWIVGHFHITVGGPVSLTFLAVTWRLLPALVKKELWSQAWASAQVWLWFIGMATMSLAMHVQGLLGAPRRTADISYAGAAVAQSWHPWALLAAAGGTLLILSVIAFVVNVVMTVASGQPSETEELVFATARPGEEAPPLMLDRIALWAGVSLALAVIAYVGPLTAHFSMHPFEVPGMRTW
jgi:cytochrome c oxidase subunit 1